MSCFLTRQLQLPRLILKRSVVGVVPASAHLPLRGWRWWRLAARALTLGGLADGCKQLDGCERQPSRRVVCLVPQMDAVGVQMRLARA